MNKSEAFGFIFCLLLITLFRYIIYFTKSKSLHETGILSIKVAAVKREKEKKKEIKVIIAKIE